MKLQLLGTGTCAYNQNRMSSSVLVKLEKESFVFDFGRGVTHRLMFDLGYEINDIKTIWLSHFHPDHISDIIPFFHALSWSKSGWQRNQKDTSILRIIGPVGLKNWIDKLLAIYPTPDLIRTELSHRIQIIELFDATFTLFNTEFELAKLPHANNTAIKFQLGDKRVVIGGDSPFSTEEIRFISNCDIAIIDAGHKTDDEIIQTAYLSHAKKIILTHIDRSLNMQELNEKAYGKGYNGSILEGFDLMNLLL